MFKKEMPFVRRECIQRPNGRAARYFQDCAVVTVVLNILGLRFFNMLYGRWQLLGSADSFPMMGLTRGLLQLVFMHE